MEEEPWQESNNRGMIIPGINDVVLRKKFEKIDKKKEGRSKKRSHSLI